MKYLRPYGFVRDVTLVPNALLRHKNLNLTAKLVWAVLARMSAGKNYTFASVGNVAAELDLSQRAVITALTELVADGFLERRRRGQGRTNLYYFLVHPVFADLVSAEQDEPPKDVKAEPPPPSRSEKTASPEVQNLHFKKGRKCSSGSAESSPVSNPFICQKLADERPSVAAGSEEPTKTYFERVRDLLAGYMDGHLPPPDDQVVARVIEAANGASADQIFTHLKHLWNEGQTPRHVNGPRGYAWFVPVLARRFGKSRPQAGLTPVGEIMKKIQP